MNRDQDPLLDAALRLTDGQAVDWGQVSQDLEGSRQVFVERLRQI